MTFLHESATALSRRIATGDLSSTEVVTEAIARMDRIDPALNAIVWRNDDDALAQAKRADAAVAAGDDLAPFHGIPIPIKELTWVAGQPGTFGSLGVDDAPRPHSDRVAELFQEGGFILHGRSNSPEAGPMSVTENRRFGVTRNPWNTAHSPAGSSGGAAAAVAGGMAAVAHATDGGGSIRMPASATGLIGLKPSRGRVPTRTPMWEHSIVDGVIARHVEDVAGTLDVLAVRDPHVAYTAPAPDRPFAAEVGAPLAPLRVGLVTDSFNGLPVDSECTAAAESLASALEHLGHEVVPVRPRLYSLEAIQGFLDVVVNAWLWATPYDDPELAEPYIRARRERARGIHAGEYAIAVTRLYAETGPLVAQWGRDFDVLLTPTMATTPPLVGTVLDEANRDFDGARVTESQMVAYTAFCNIAGLPAVSLPVHTSAAGLPVGAQIVGRPFGEAELIRIASAVEPAFGWTTRIPADVR
ncbi:amidase [Microbacterium chocolatum]|uniref:amidase n=1 Tax=Microbacterium aurantiacum TaxID=162393 RepID=UPI00338F3411